MHTLLPKENIFLHGPAGFDSQIVPSHHSLKGTELPVYRETPTDAIPLQTCQKMP